MRRTNTILAFMALMIVASVAFMYLAGIWAVESSENARHKQQVIAALNNFLSTLKDAETGQRGYLLVDEDRYLAPYQTALAMMATRLEKIDALVESQDIDAADAAMLKQLAGDKLTELNRTIEVRRSQGIDAAIAIVRAGHGQETMEKIRTLVAKMIDVQAGRLRLVQEDADVAGRTRTVIFSCLVLVNLGFLAWASSRIAKEIQNRIAAANEAALQKNLLSVTLSSIGDAVIATDPGSAITFMNPTAERLTGWTAADAKGKTLAQVFNIVNEDSRQSVESPVAKALRLGTIVGLANHTLLLGKDGREWPIDDSAAPIRDESGAVIGVVMVFHDISDRRATETALRRSEHELADFFENASVGLHWAGPDGIILRANQTELDMLGYSREEYVGRHIADFHADQPAIEDILKRLNCGESLHEVPAKLRRKDGSIRDVLISSNVLFENGKFIHTRCFTHDITERLRAEQEREHFVALAENSPNFVGMCDLAGVPFYVNRQGLELVGLDSLDQARRTPVAEFFFPEDRPTIVDEFFPSIVAKGQGEIEIRFRHFKTGKPIWMIYSVITLRDPFGKPTALATVSRDITERKMNEEALRDSENRYRRLFEAARDGVLILDAQTRKITDVNPFLMRLLDSPRDYFVGRELWEMGLFPNKAAAEEAFQKLHGANSLRFENLPLLDRNGTIHPVEVLANIYLQDRDPMIQCNVRDITERVEFERDRALLLANEQATRLEAQAANRSKDMFLATLSHEMRTPLNAIVGWMNILRQAGCTAEDLREGLDVIERNTNAQVQLIEDVLDVSRIVSGKLRLEMKTCELSEIIQAGLDAVRPAAEAKTISLHANLEPSASTAICDAARIQQVLWNLLSNAVKFTQKGGEVNVTLARAESSMQIEVSDNGQGISTDLLPYVFDRFRQADSSSRRKFGGLGLGLSIVKHIVEMHGGTVEAASAGENRGSSFVVKLPIQAVRVDELEEEPGRTGGSGERKEAGEKSRVRDLSQVRLDGIHILVVDDEADARRVVTKVLENAGATIHAAGSAAEAMRVLETESPNVLVSDLGMPVEDGFDLIRQVRAAGRNARDFPAVALTAFARKDDQRKALLAGFQVHVGKPVDPHDLIAAIASLAGPRAGQVAGERN